jgi:thiol:disulfide interchange protein DsbC
MDLLTTRLTRGFVLLAILAAAGPASSRTGASGERAAANIAQTLESRFPNIKVLDVRPGPLPSLYEVYTGTEILYTDKTGDYLFSGSLIDTRTKKDLTAEQVDTRNAIDFATLPFDKAIKVVKGSGARKLAIFTDPDCPYCQAFEQELKTVSDVTVYTFLFPLTRIHPNAERHARAIWCSPDRAQAWTVWMQEKKEPEAQPCDAAPIEELSTLGEKLHIAGTPTLYFETGRRVSHGLSSADLEQSLNDNSKLAVHSGAATPDAGCAAPSAATPAPSCTFDTKSK